MAKLEEHSLRDLMCQVEEIIKGGKTPLIVDQSPQKGAVDTFYGYQSAQIMDTKKMVMDHYQGKQPVEEVLEGARKKLVLAMKHGQTFLVAMTSSAPEFPEKFSNPDILPLEFLKAGEAEKPEFVDKIVKDEEKEHGVFVVRPGFQVVVTTQFGPDDYEEFLNNVKFPFEFVKAIKIV